MGHECNRFHHHIPLHIHHRNTFLPMLCSRPSIKDVKLPNWENRSASFSDEPLSPKIGCMGQVKRNNKVIGFPASSHRFTLTRSTTTNNINVKYSKLKRLFSGKNLTPAAATATGANANNGSVSVRRRVVVNGANGSRNGYNNNSSSSSNGENCVPTIIDVVDLDPPLPVIKKVQKTEQEGEVDSLWKRRSGGVALKSLQLQQIHHPKHHLQPTTV